MQEYEERPEDCIPDTKANQEARDFLANAPSKGLWMPLGKEVKVMQCKLNVFLTEFSDYFVAKCKNLLLFL